MQPLVIFLVMIAAVYQFFFRYERWPSEKKPGVMYEHDNLTGSTHIIEPGSKASVFARILSDGEGGDSETMEGDRSRRGDTLRLVEPLERDGRQERSRYARYEQEALGTDSSDGPIDLRNIRGRDRDMDGNVSPRNSKDERTLASIDLRDARQVEKASRPVPTPREVVVASSSPPVPMANESDNLTDVKSNSKFAVKQVKLSHDAGSEEIIQTASQSDGLLDISIVKNGREIFYGRGKQISLLPTRNRQGWSDIVLKSSGGNHGKVFRYDLKEGAYRELSDNEG